MPTTYREITPLPATSGTTKQDTVVSNLPPWASYTLVPRHYVWTMATPVSITNAYQVTNSSGQKAVWFRAQKSGTLDEIGYVNVNSLKLERGQNMNFVPPREMVDENRPPSEPPPESKSWVGVLLACGVLGLLWWMSRSK